MRKHQPIWEQIKATKTVRVAAPSEAHKLIVNAVRKEKCRDYAWKVLCTEANTAYRLMNESEGGVLTFTLVVDTTIKNL